MKAGFDSPWDRQHTVAEWLRRGLQILVCEFDSHRCVQLCILHTKKGGHSSVVERLVANEKVVSANLTVRSNMKGK
jgi:predicted kinase